MQKCAESKVRFLQYCLFLVLCLFVFLPTTAFAQEVYTTQVTIDDANWQIIAGVINQTVGGRGADTGGQVIEVKRIGSSALNSLAANNGDPAVGANLLSGASFDEAGYPSDFLDKNMVMTYPGKSLSTLLLFHKNSTEYDQARATVVKDTLLYDLNAAYSLVYGGAQPSDLSEYQRNMIALLQAVSSNGTIGNFSFSKATDSDITKVADKTMNASDYVVISDGTTTKTYAYRMPKGYVRISGRDFSELDTLASLSSGEDATYITWGEFVYEAFATYQLDGTYSLDSEDVYTGTTGALEAILVGAFQSLTNGLSNMLGLWSMDELVFNSGVRGSSAYIGGVFPSAWESIIWTFFYIMEIISLIVLSFSILAGIYKKALSTVNPMVRASFMAQVHNTIVMIFILILLPIIFRLIFSTSETLTEIFSSALGDASAKQAFTYLSQNSGSLAGCIMQFVYLCSLIYFNFFYFIRSLLTAVLMIIAPLCVMAYSLGESGKGVTSDWLKTFAATIFVQPIHALILALVLLLPMDRKGLQSIVAIYSLIPISNMVKDVAFRGFGNGMHMAAQTGGGKTSNILGSIGKGVVSGTTGALVGYGVGRMSSGHADEQASENGQQSTNQGTENPVNTEPSAAEKAANAAAASNGSPQSDEFSGRNAEPVAQTVGGGQSVHAGTDSSEKFYDEVSPGDTRFDDQNTPTNKSDKTGIKNTAKTVLSGVAMAAAGGFLQGVGIRTPIATMGTNYLMNAGKGISQTTSKTNQGSRMTEKQPEPGAKQPSLNPHGILADEAVVAANNPMGADSWNPDIYDSLGQTNYYENGLLNKSSNGFNAYSDPKEGSLKDLGMHVKTEKTDKEKTPPTTATISYDFDKLQDRDKANATALYDLSQNGTPEQKQALADSGITAVNAEMSTNGLRAIQFVADKEKLRENYGIDLNGKSMSNKRCVSFGSQEIVPNVIKSPQINSQITSESSPVSDPTQETSQTLHGPSSTLTSGQIVVEPSSDNRLEVEQTSSVVASASSAGTEPEINGTEVDPVIKQTSHPSEVTPVVQSDTMGESTSVTEQQATIDNASPVGTSPVVSESAVESTEQVPSPEPSIISQSSTATEKPTVTEVVEPPSATSSPVKEASVETTAPTIHQEQSPVATSSVSETINQDDFSEPSQEQPPQELESTNLSETPTKVTQKNKKKEPSNPTKIDMEQIILDETMQQD